MRHTLLPRLAVCIIITLLAAIAIVPAASAGTTRVGGRYPSYAYAAASRHGLAVYVNGLVKQDYSTGVVGSPRRTVYLQRYVRGGWQPMLRRVTSSSGHVTVGFVSVASYQLRWVVVATASAWGATSRPTRPPAYVPPARTLGVSAATGRLALYYASSSRGAPYRSGGAGPWQFDCSGLTLWSYGRVGRRLPRTADQQYRATIRLSSAQRRAGDLVFFLSGGRSYHTGIYAGSGRLWHAPGAGRYVRLSVIWTSAVAYGRVR